MTNPYLLPQRVQFVDSEGCVTREWYKFLQISTNTTISNVDGAYAPPTVTEEQDDQFVPPTVTEEQDEWFVPPTAEVPVSYSTTPSVKTADFTVGDETYLINNKSGSSCTITLPDAAAYTGRMLSVLNYQAQTVVSSASNVVPITGGAAGTAMVAATAGKWVILVSDGTNWLILQAN